MKIKKLLSVAMLTTALTVNAYDVSSSDFSSLEETVRSNTGEIEELKKEVADLKELVMQLMQNESNTSANSGGAELSADETIKKATELMKKKKNGEARNLLNAFIAKNQKDIHVGMMHFYLGDSFYKEKNHRAAAKEFMKSYNVNSRGEKAPEALYKLGLCFKHMSDKKKSVLTLEKLVEDHPSSKFCEKAKKELANMKK